MTDINSFGVVPLGIATQTQFIFATVFLIILTKVNIMMFIRRANILILLATQLPVVLSPDDLTRIIHCISQYLCSCLITATIKSRVNLYLKHNVIQLVNIITIMISEH